MSRMGRGMCRFLMLTCEIFDRLGVYLVNEPGWKFDGSVDCT